FTWAIVGYDTENGRQTLLLERPETIQSGAQDVQISTPNRDFEKRIELYASVDRQDWKLIAEGTVFDFSSHIPLRRTTLELPEETTAPYLKVVLEENRLPLEQGENLRFRYKDLEFALDEQQPGALQITDVRSRVVQGTAQDLRRDHVTISNPQVSSDGSATRIDLGRINLPLERVSLAIGKGFFSRLVELWVSETGEDETYRRVADDMIYRIPGIADEDLTLNFDQPQHPYVRLKIINHDNPPLAIDAVTLGWVRRELYFIPEAGHEYTLYCGAQEMPPPRYDMQQLIPDRFDLLMRYPAGHIGALTQNPIYRSKADPSLWALLEQYGVIVLVLILAGGLGVWIFHLLKKIPKNV
ncbi:DUF3999 family protein, partial [candidate division KSB3 bacterium]|nr:DUF3999 family protein [candidate division KSB3 bacterium]MBD3325208.1 DUF3999 family protein [candidate division KSB3 bacterium]